MKKPIIAAALGAAALTMSGAAGAQPRGETARPTIVLAHGAFAESSSWNAVITDLQARGYPVVAAAIPLRGVASDAAYLSTIVRSIPGPVVLVGHSYGGEVISVAGNGAANVRALVYVAGYAPDAGESAVSLSARFPEGTLGPALAPPVPTVDGARDLYILPARFHAQFAADLPAGEAAVMAATQRPVTEAALAEPLAGPVAWRATPSWFIYGERDLNIPRTLHAFMARRASARETVEVAGASHVVMISHPAAVAAMIDRAASAR